VAVVGKLPRNARRVRAALVGLGLPAEIYRLVDPARSVAEAAAAVGCERGAIVKTLVFRGQRSGEPVLALVSGGNRADEALVAVALGEPVERPDATYVRDKVGYAIAGIPPVGHRAPVRTVLDEDLLRYATVWAAAGTPDTVFAVAPAALATATDARVGRLADR
jgi:prolyl-tRNA editing enzyme YbaK/EbsC (Cys-tRNA(Pro) deacylase)